MGLRTWQKATIGFLMLIVGMVLVAGSLIQIQQGHFFNPPDTPQEKAAQAEMTFAEKVEQARKSLNFGR